MLPRPSPKNQAPKNAHKIAGVNLTKRQQRKQGLLRKEIAKRRRQFEAQRLRNRNQDATALEKRREEMAQSFALRRKEKIELRKRLLLEKVARNANEATLEQTVRNNMDIVGQVAQAELHRRWNLLTQAQKDEKSEENRRQQQNAREELAMQDPFGNSDSDEFDPYSSYFDDEEEDRLGYIRTQMKNIQDGKLSEEEYGARAEEIRLQLFHLAQTTRELKQGIAEQKILLYNQFLRRQWSVGRLDRVDSSEAMRIAKGFATEDIKKILPEELQNITLRF